MRTALVTGAASGIGAATARLLAGGGWRVIAADVRARALVALAEEVGVEAVELDVADEASVRDAFGRVASLTPSLDALVCSAGIVAVSRFEASSQAEWERVLRVNVVGSYLCLQAALPLLRAAAPPARVVNLASTAGKVGAPSFAAYAASKAAVISLTRSAAVALAPDVLVNCVCPGPVETPMWSDAIDPAMAELGVPDALAARAAEIPLGRAGRPDEVARVIEFLLGDGGAYIVGEDLNVNGGVVLH
ncbi:MAG: SDR family oxidoreductase [Thermoleophilia bacterium]